MVESGVELDAERGIPSLTVPSTRPSLPRRAVIALVAGALFVALAALLGYGLSRSGDATGSGGESVGKVAPEFRLPGLDGGTVALADLGARPVFVYFWASWCVPCKEEAPILEALSREYGDRIAFVGINIQDTDEAARGFVRDFRLTFPTARDRDGRIYLDYGVFGVPESFFLGSDRVITQHWIGPLDEAELRSALEGLVAG
jgi:cytochrome c biogenesis protein CcmG/thiol:disulfide interchange protein DsbE